MPPKLRRPCGRARAPRALVGLWEVLQSQWSPSVVDQPFTVIAWAPPRQR